MPGRASQAFLKAIFDIAVERCGKEFENEVVFLRRERERLLRDSWRELPPEELPPSGEEEVFREIDFDTVVAHSARYLETHDYLAFLFDVAERAIGSGEFEKAPRLLTLIVTRYPRSADKSLLARSHQRLGDVAFYQNDPRKAREKYRQSLNLYERLEDPEGIASVTNSLASLMVEGGKVPEAERLFIQARKLAEDHGLRELTLKIECNLGNLYLMQGAWGKAVTSYEKALAANPDTPTRARIHHNLGLVYAWRENYDRAVKNLETSVELSTEVNDLYQKGLSYLGLAEVLCHRGDFSRATALATTAFQIFSELGDRLSVAEVYKVFGIINRERDRPDVALSYFENSIRINKDYKNPLNLGETLQELAELHRKSGDIRKARKSLKEAIGAFKETGAREKMAAVRAILASLE